MRPLGSRLYALSSHIYTRNGTFYYRADIPKDLKHLFAISEIKQSLKTKSPKDAKVLAVSLEYKIQKAFIALRTSYRVSPTSKVKAEWARTQTGDVSSFVDAPSGGESGHKVINVFSLSYNFVF